MSGNPEKYNGKLRALTLLIAAALIARLLMAAYQTSDWRAFSISGFHVLFVAVVVYWVLRVKGAHNSE